MHYSSGGRAAKALQGHGAVGVQMTVGAIPWRGCPEAKDAGEADGRARKKGVKGATLSPRREFFSHAGYRGDM
jgi:hypothetical protein